MNPIAFQIGNLPIRWYGIFYAIGFLFAYLIVPKLAKSRNIRKIDIQNLFIYLIPFSIIGARLTYVLVNLNYYLKEPLEIFAIWNGGMAFHGGLIAAIILVLIYCKKKNIHFYDVADILVIPLALALALGRIGNFLNSEFYGPLTNLPWGAKFNGVEGKRHPTQIYESIKNLFIFFILISMHKIKEIKKGFIFWTFIFLYSFLRFFVEFLKITERYIFGLTWGQIISFPLIIISGIILYKLKKK
jgi:phosphatidylglycerol---prolipoprotein diacylglyceryl transferase